MARTSLDDTIFTVILIFVILLVGIAVLNPVAEQTTQSDSSTRDITRDAVLLPDDTSFVDFNNGYGDGETVYETTGYAVNLTGADDSYVQSRQGFELATDKNWTVSVWAYVDQGAGNDNMTVVSANGRVIIGYNGSNSQWTAWYYDESTRDSHRVNVPTAGNEVGNYTNVMAWANGTHLSIYRNNTQGESVDLSTDEIVSAPVDSGTWDGRLEELRTFDRALDGTNRSQIVTNPTEEAPTFAPTSRAMFDQPDTSTQLLLYTGTKLQQSNVSFDAGFPEDTQSAGTDYQWDTDGPQIRFVSGGDLDGAPVAYASYRFNPVSGGLDQLTDWLYLAAIVPVLVVVGYIVLTVRTTR